MLKGKCPKCGAEYVGWALSNPHHRKCDKCKVELVIINEEKTKVEKMVSPPEKTPIFASCGVWYGGAGNSGQLLGVELLFLPFPSPKSSG